MKIFVINPNTSENIRQVIDAKARQYARPETEILTACSTKGPMIIENAYEESLAGEGMLERVIEANKKKYDAIVIAAYNDPHIRSAREISNVPVYGIGESSMHMASLLGHKFSIVTVLDSERLILLENLVKQVGLETKCASIRTAMVSPAEMEEDPDSHAKVFTEAAREALISDGAEAICIGCSGFAGVDKQMEAELGVPVLDGVVCAVKIAEAAFEYGLSLSKVKTYKKPAPKEYVGMKKYVLDY